jgi:hypothetical protein
LSAVQKRIMLAEKKNSKVSFAEDPTIIMIDRLSQSDSKDEVKITELTIPEVP